MLDVRPSWSEIKMFELKPQPKPIAPSEDENLEGQNKEEQGDKKDNKKPEKGIPPKEE